MVKKKLFVGNLPNNYDGEKLRDSFEQYGIVAECDVLRNYGFVHMENEDEAEAAVRALHHSRIDDCQINVQYSTTEVHKNPGVGSKGECFRCGKTGHFSRECPTNTNGGGRPRGRGRGRGRGGRGGGDGGYSNGRDNFHPPHPMRDGYYEFYDDYYRRPLPPPGYGYRERSHSPPRRPVTPPGYRRRYSPTREYYERYYERIPTRDPYYDYNRRPSPSESNYRRPPPPEEYRREPEDYRRPSGEEFRERPPLPRDVEYYRRLEGKRPPPRKFEEREMNRMPAEREFDNNNTHFMQQPNLGSINFAEDVNF